MATNNPSSPRFGCYIGNIDRSVTLDILKQVFCQCGTIVDCSLNGRDEDPYRYGFIDFATEDDRSRAMKYNGFTLVGRKLKVGISKGNVNKPEGFTTMAANTNSSGAPSRPMGNNPAAAAMGGMMGGGMMPQAGGLLPQQQMEAQFLLGLIQQGSLDPGSLSEQQRTLLMAILSGNNAAAPAAQAAPPAAAMMPQMLGAQQMWPMNAGRGNFQNMQGMGGMQGMPGMNPRYHRGPANPPPSDEILKRRELQRKQFLKCVRDVAEDYEKQLQEKSAKGGARSAAASDDSSASDDDEKPSKRSKAE